jgi:hypothetical protein
VGVNYPKFNEDLRYPAYTRHPWPEVEEWCNDNIGPWNQEWYKLGEDAAAMVFDAGYRSTYFFRTEEQAIIFTLRWA